LIDINTCVTLKNLHQVRKSIPIIDQVIWLFTFRIQIANRYIWFIIPALTITFDQFKH